jgi:hypothetical protein
VEGESAFDFVRERPALNGRKADVSINPTWSVVSAKIVEPDIALIVDIVDGSSTTIFWLSASKSERQADEPSRKRNTSRSVIRSEYVIQALCDSPNQLLLIGDMKYWPSILSSSQSALNETIESF